MATQQDVLRIDDDAGPAVLVQPPARLQRFVQRVSRLQPGKYVLTLTIAHERAWWTIQEMNSVEG